MVKVTLEVLNEKIDGIREDLKDIRCEQKLNTEFRQKATGIVGFVGFVCASIGGLLVWLLGKFWK